jgi:hypothetical protein
MNLLSDRNLVALSTADEAAWLAKHGRIIVITLGGKRYRPLEPWERGGAAEDVSAEELDRQADYLRSVGEPDRPVKPWAELSEAERGFFREIARGNAGAALG